MAKTGDRFEMPDGSSYVLAREAAETGGASVEMEFVLPPGSVSPPLHVHPGQVERFEVIEGSFDLVVDGSWHTLGTGESASVPIGVAHTFKNRSDEVVRVRNWHEPALRFEDYIERNHVTLRRAGVKSGRDPRVPIYLSMIIFEFEETLRPARRRERIPMRALAGLGRLLRFDISPA
jgi:quercetin dioxygenase-like cupin family protein